MDVDTEQKLMGRPNSIRWIDGSAVRTPSEVAAMTDDRTPKEH
jgi:hypothetical protein